MPWGAAGATRGAGRKERRERTATIGRGMLVRACGGAHPCRHRPPWPARPLLDAALAADSSSQSPLSHARVQAVRTSSGDHCCVVGCLHTARVQPSDRSSSAALRLGCLHGPPTFARCRAARALKPTFSGGHRCVQGGAGCQTPLEPTPAPQTSGSVAFACAIAFAQARSSLACSSRRTSRRIMPRKTSVSTTCGVVLYMLATTPL